MNPIMEIVKGENIRVIKDAAQAIGAWDTKGRQAGTIGHMGCLSFFPSKNLGAFGGINLWRGSQIEIGYGCSSEKRAWKPKSIILFRFIYRNVFNLSGIREEIFHKPRPLHVSLWLYPSIRS
jgi:hypothetical protein